MAERSATLRVIDEAEQLTRESAEDVRKEAAARPHNQAAIDAQVSWLEEHGIPDLTGIGCACVGPTRPCTLCGCHIREEALARIEGRPCQWAHLPHVPD